MSNKTNDKIEDEKMDLIEDIKDYCQNIESSFKDISKDLVDLEREVIRIVEMYNQLLSILNVPSVEENE